MFPENDEGSKWKKKTDIKRFMVARDGDMLCASFQCDHCWFMNLKKVEPIDQSYEHHCLLGQHIHREIWISCGVEREPLLQIRWVQLEKE